MALVVRSGLALFLCVLAVAGAPAGDHGSDGMVVEDLSEILRGEDRYARCPPQKILIGDRCRQILSEEELRKVSLLEEYSDCVRKNAEDLGGRNETNLAQIHRYCMKMCMLSAEGL